MEIHNSPFLQMIYYIETMKIFGLISEDISFAEYVMLQLITEMSNETGGADRLSQKCSQRILRRRISYDAWIDEQASNSRADKL